MKTIKYGFFVLIVVGIFSLLVAINRTSSNGHVPAESNTSTPAESGVQEKLEARTEQPSTNNVVTNVVVFKISPKFGGFRKQ